MPGITHWGLDSGRLHFHHALHHKIQGRSSHGWHGVELKDAGMSLYSMFCVILTNVCTFACGGVIAVHCNVACLSTHAHACPIQMQDCANSCPHFKVHAFATPTTCSTTQAQRSFPSHSKRPDGGGRTSLQETVPDLPLRAHDDKAWHGTGLDFCSQKTWLPQHPQLCSTMSRIG